LASTYWVAVSSSEDFAMNLYECYFNRFVGDVPEFVVIDAKDDDQARVVAIGMLDDHPNYASVDILRDGRQIAELHVQASG
jgi:hypothetical protein